MGIHTVYRIYKNDVIQSLLVSWLFVWNIFEISVADKSQSWQYKPTATTSCKCYFNVEVA